MLRDADMRCRSKTAERRRVLLMLMMLLRATMPRAQQRRVLPRDADERDCYTRLPLILFSPFLCRVCYHYRRRARV